MEEQSGARVIGMALLEGRMSLRSLVEVGAALPPGQGDEPERLLDELVKRGALDAERREDFTPTEQMSGGGERTSQVRSGADQRASGLLWREVPEGEEVDGRRILSALTLPQWKQYRNLRFVGEGGMGRIFKAFDPSLKRMVALKFLRRDAGDFLERFMLEAQSQARVDHPNICKVYEVGEWRGQAYIAMQFLRGTTLDVAYVDLEVEQRLSIMETVAEAVHAAHRQGLIHRDLKPANIMIERSEEALKAYVLDFGLARGMETSGLTVQGIVLGTAHYMAPEQARGENDRLGRRSDVYSLGCCLYAVLAGEPPFAKAKGLDCVRMVAQEEVPALSSMVPGLPADLDTIVMKCLEKDPERRYESARALAEDLRRFRDMEPILARPATFSYRMGKLARKHKSLVAASAVAFLTVLVLLGLFVGAKLDASAQARHAQHFGQEAERIEALVRYAHILPAHDLRPEMDQVALRMRALEGEAARHGRLAAGPVAYALGRGYLAVNDPEKALARFQEADGRGFRSPDLHYAWGRALGLLYQKAMDQAFRIPDPEARGARVRELGRRLKEPALAHLKAGTGATLESPAYLEALLAFYEKRYDEALARARSVFNQTAWFYEARRLEGDILSARAMEVQDSARAIRDLADAAQVYRKAARIAPSDPSLLLGEARSLREAMARGEDSGQNPREAMAACREACGRAQGLWPGGGEPQAILSRACALYGRYQELHGEAFQGAMEEAVTLAHQALDKDPRDLEALGAAINAHTTLGRAQRAQGLDPRSHMDQAIVLGRAALALDPSDSAAFFGVRAHLFKMAYESTVGLSPWATFESGLRMASEIVKHRPGEAIYVGYLGYLWGERAEYERTHGLDPGASVDMSARFFREAIALNGSHAGLHYGLANACQIQGEHRLSLGLPAQEELEKALDAFRKVVELNPGNGAILDSMAAVHLDLARAKAAQGRDPGPSLKACRETAGQGLAQNAKDAIALDTLDEADLMEARWLRDHGRDAAPLVESAISRGLKAAALRPESLVLCHLAMAYRFRAEGGLHGGDLVQGLRWVQRALEMDPSNAQALLERGALEWLQALRASPAARALGEARARSSMDRALALNRNLEREVRSLQESLKVSGRRRSPGSSA